MKEMLKQKLLPLSHICCCCQQHHASSLTGTSTAAARTDALSITNAVLLISTNGQKGCVNF